MAVCTQGAAAESHARAGCADGAGAEGAAAGVGAQVLPSEQEVCRCVGMVLVRCGSFFRCAWGSLVRACLPGCLAPLARLARPCGSNQLQEHQSLVSKACLC